MLPIPHVFSVWALSGPAAVAPPETGRDADVGALEARAAEALEDCSMCHSGGDEGDPAALDLSGPPSSLLGVRSAVNGRPLVVPGKPDESYLLAKIRGDEGIDGERMPIGDDPLSDEAIAAVEAWIAALPPQEDAGSDEGASGTSGGDRGRADGGEGKGKGRGKGKARGRKPFFGTQQAALPTTTTLGKRTLLFRIDHRFGRIGAERGAFGLDVGAIISFQLAYGILDGWDVLLRRTNSRKDWELGTKYLPVRQEDGMPLSFGAYASMEWLRDFEVANEFTGNLMLLLSRLWFDRWVTMLTFGYHFDTNHNPRVIVDRGDGPELVRDRRDTITLGLASSVFLGKKKRWSIDLEYILPVPDGKTPNVFYRLGGDAGPEGLTQVGAWALGGSFRTGLHVFTVIFTNNREIHTNLWAPGGQTDNPFDTPGVDRAINEPNFFLGFNLARRFKL
ncbi:MAG: hypothetical protein D6705_03690 [Deltaproteobacteria bacterium]|nr:MAG: hypothetical protein D6705_03690 [Deltaproteobacteria bacterium]